MHHPGDSPNRLRFGAAFLALTTALLLFGGASAASARPLPKATCTWDLVNDQYSTNQDTVLNVPAAGVLENDTLCGVGNVTLETDVSHGSLTLNDNGSFSYTPSPGFFGDDTFVYSFSQQLADIVRPATFVPIEDHGVVTIHVLSTCSTLLRDDAYATSQDTPLGIAPSGVLVNDTICFLNDGPVVVTPPSHGTVTNFDNQAGGFTYTPNAGFTGTDTFTYTLAFRETGIRPAIPDNLLATVTITITPTPQPTTTVTTTTLPPTTVPPPTIFLPTTTTEEPTTTEVPSTTIEETTTEPPATELLTTTTTTTTAPPAVAAEAGNQAPLARTGSDISSLLFIGITMVGLGLGLALLARRRRGIA